MASSRQECAGPSHPECLAYIAEDKDAFLFQHPCRIRASGLPDPQLMWQRWQCHAVTAAGGYPDCVLAHSAKAAIGSCILKGTTMVVYLEAFQ